MSLLAETLPPEAEEPALMGILNVTPDSFYDGGRYDDLESAVTRAQKLVEAGAEILDIGGASSRPGAEEISPEMEKQRLIPVLEALAAADLQVPISVDTFHASVAKAALDAGAAWINDITALRADPGLAELVAAREVPVVLMHMQGTPQDMQKNPEYSDVIEDVCHFFERRVEFALQQGITEDQLILDPGIGFGKTLAHNGRLLSQVEQFSQFELPVLVGHSRKSYLGELLHRPVEERLPGTLATSAHLILKNVDIIRVHDVGAHVDLRTTLNWLASGD